MFAVAAGADASGIALGWNSWLARLFYATGPALVVAFLAIGQLYLLFPVAMRRFGAGATLLVTALWVSLVINAPIDADRLAADGWDAIDRGPEMVAITILINAVGTLIIVGGTAWSVFRYWRRGANRNRMTGCALICAGALMVATGGSLTRLGHYEYLYIAMAIGIATIFSGVLVSRRPDVARRLVPATSESPRVVPAPTAAPTQGQMPGHVCGLGFVHELLLAHTDPEIDAVCTEWSVPRESASVFSRNEARRAWRLRVMLSPEALRVFDEQSVGGRRQLAGLYHDVLAWERSGREDIAEITSSPKVAGSTRQA